MKAEYLYCVKMPTVGLLHKTIRESEASAITAFSQFDGRLSWLEALNGGYKVVKILVVELL